MAAKHGTAWHYNLGCRCADCKNAHRLRAADYRQRRLVGDVRASECSSSPPGPNEPGPVESGVKAEIAQNVRPGLAQAALAMARILDNPRAINHQPAAAKVLAAVLDRLNAASARGRRSGLALVRNMTDKGGA